MVAWRRFLFALPLLALPLAGASVALASDAIELAQAQPQAQPNPAPSPTPSASPAPATDTQPAAVEPIGNVATVTGIATVVRDKNSYPLRVRDDIYLNDVVQTSSNSSLGITFNDATTFNLSASAKITIDNYVYEDGGKQNSAIFDIGKGTVAFVAAAVAKTGDMKIATPTATLGIRGTTGVVDVPEGAAASAANNVNIKLYPDADGRVGHIEVNDRTSGTRLGALSRLQAVLRSARAPAAQAACALPPCRSRLPRSRSRVTAASSARCIWRRPRAGRSSPSSATSAAPIRPRSAAFRGRPSRRSSSSNCGRRQRPVSSHSGRTASPARTTVQASSSRARRAARAPSRRSGKDKAAPCSRARHARARVSSSEASNDRVSSNQVSSKERDSRQVHRVLDKAHSPAALCKRSHSGTDRARRSPAESCRRSRARRRSRKRRAPACSRASRPRLSSQAASSARAASSSASPPRNVPQHRADRRPLRRRRKSGGERCLPSP